MLPRFKKYLSLQETNAFACFNVTADISLPDRERFVKFLASRFALDGHKVWKSFIGNGTSSGLLHQAKYHASPLGVAAVAEAQRAPLKIPLPESEHQRAWLRTWQDLRKKPHAHAEARELIEVYLATVSGTGTVERWIKEKGDIMADRATMHVRGLETSLKLLIQDQGGRRREKLNPQKMLVKEVPTKVAGGATVVYPASNLLLKAQRKYAEWYGVRTQPGRSWEVCGPKDLASARIKAGKPRLAPSKQSNTAGKSEKQQLEAHARSCREAIAEVQAGRSAEGILGPVDLAGHGAPKKRLLEDAAAACWELRSASKSRDSGGSLAFVGQSASGAASSTSVPCGPDASAQKAIAVQEEVLAKRRKAAERAVPGKPIEYVDSQGGAMRFKASKPETKQSKPPKFPAEPRILLATSKPAAQVLPPNGTRVSLGHCSDIVVVESILLNFDAAEALQARLDGAHLVDLAGRSLCFQGAMKQLHLVLLVAETFASSHPSHTVVLEKCSARSPRMKVQGESELLKRFDVKCTDFVPDTLRWPTLTYKLVAEVNPEEVVTCRDGRGKAVKLQFLDLKGLLNLCGRCFEQ